MTGGGGATQSSSQNSTTTSTSQPWGGVAPFLVEALGMARGQANQPAAQFPYVWQSGYSSPISMASQYGIPGFQGSGQYATYSPQNWYGVNTSDYGQSQTYNPYMGQGVGTTPGTQTTGGAGGGTYNPYGASSSYNFMNPYAGASYDPYQMGAYNYGANPYNVSGDASYTPYQGGYYQNFATGQTMPYSNYLPYVSEVAPMNFLQNMGLEQVANLTAGGDPTMSAASGMVTDTLQGKYLSPESNPYLRSTYQAAADPTMQNYLNAVYPGLRSSAAQAGQFGSSSDALLQGQAQYNLGKTLGDLATGIYGGNYQAERANQLKAGLEAPSISQGMFTYPSQLLNAGNIYQQQAQNQLADMVSQWQQKVNYPTSMLQNYASIIAGLPVNYGSSTGQSFGTASSPNPYYVSPGQQTLGAASSLGGLGLGLGALLMGL